MIKVGDKIPAATLYQMGDKGPEGISTATLFDGKKVVLFALPGAFTPTCSSAHVPGYVVNADAIKAKGVDSIICLSVNDAFVMSAWGEQQNAEHLLMLGDGSAELTQAMGVEFTIPGMGMRCQRLAMIVDNGVVTHVALEAPKEFKVSSAEAILEAL